jgi:hypothetical protein
LTVLSTPTRFRHNKGRSLSPTLVNECNGDFPPIDFH